MKECRKCGKEKEAGEFPRSPDMRDGLSSWCKACHRAATQRWRDKNRDRINKAQRVVPRFIFDAELMRTVPNPDARPKSRVR